MVHTTLQYTTSMPMGGNLHAMLAGSIVNELTVFRPKSLKTALHNMISIEIFDEKHDSWAEGSDGDVHLLRRVDGLHQLLYRARPVGVQCYLDDARQALLILQRLATSRTNEVCIMVFQDGVPTTQALQHSEYASPLVIRAALQQLLHQVVTKGVYHELHHVGQNLCEDDGYSIRTALIKLPLKKTAPMLVPSQGHYLASSLLQGVELDSALAIQHVGVLADPHRPLSGALAAGHCIRAWRIFSTT
mmetsp:Transcript_5564/g.7524  ORF Transcript_5564/g.7524 Transcript_5564/m.7524 type:complete len:246 (-) Transcript_5564:2259-2996(-)